jgi:hypothetical protein
MVLALLACLTVFFCAVEWSIGNNGKIGGE